MSFINLVALYPVLESRVVALLRRMISDDEAVGQAAIQPELVKRIAHDAQAKGLSGYDPQAKFNHKNDYFQSLSEIVTAIFGQS